MIHKLKSITNNETTTMNRSINLRLFAFLCAVLMPILQPSDALAQRKLVPIVCNDPNVVCWDSMFVEEGTLHPDTCGKLIDYNNCGNAYRILYAKSWFMVVGEVSREHAEEFKELAPRRSVLDSTHYRLLSAQLQEFFKMFVDHVGYYRLTVRGMTSDDPDWDKPNNRFSLKLEIDQSGMYNLWAVLQFWAASKGVDTTDACAVEQARGSTRSSVHLPVCALFVSNVSDSNRGPTLHTPLVHVGAIPITDVHGQYTVVDVSGRVVATGVMQLGEAPHVVTVRPGVYMVVTPTSGRRVLVLP